MADFDAVVVGGGPNGLAAALRLAEAGWSTCLIEAAGEVGGAARTLEVTLPGFRHDLGPAFFPLAATSPAFEGRDLERYGLRWRHAPLPAAHPFPSEQAIALGRTAPETAAFIDAVAPGDGAVWQELDRAYGEAMVLFLRAVMRRYPLADGARLLARLRLAGALDFARTLAGGASTVAAGFRTEQARAFLAAPAMHADLLPEMPGTALYALLLGLVGQRHGMPVAEGGSGALTRALAAALTDAGGVVVTGRRVDRILVERGRAVGVEAGGEPVTARHAVIAAIDPHLAVQLAGPESFPAGALSQLARFRPGVGTFKVDWALAGPVPWAAEPCRRAAVVHVADTVRDMSRAAWEVSWGLLPARPTLVLGQPTLADPSRAPAGKHVLWGYAHVPAEPVGDAARPRARGRWETSAQHFLDRMEALIEAHAPGFRDLVLARKVWTPADLEAADPSLVAGDTTGGSFAVDQQLIFRPGPAWWRWGTPLKGFYLGGAAMTPGAGVHGACGDLAARQALADHRRPRVLALGAAAAGVAALGALSSGSRGAARRR